MSQPASAPFANAVLLAVPPAGSDDALLWSPVAGRPLLAWPLAALRASAAIGPITLIVPHARLGAARRLIVAEGLADTVARESSPPNPLSLRGEGGTEAEVIVLHEAARPLVTPEQVRAVVVAAVESGFAVCAEPVKETIKRVAEGRVVETLPRDELAQLIPPLAMRADLLDGLLDAAAGSPFARISDLVAAALALGIAVRTVPLAGPSLAVTSPEELAVAVALLRPAGG